MGAKKMAAGNQVYIEHAFFPKILVGEQDIHRTGIVVCYRFARTQTSNLCYLKLFGVRRQWLCSSRQKMLLKKLMWKRRREMYIEHVNAKP